MTRRGFYLRLYPGAIRAAQLIHLLGHLQRQVCGKILLVWERLGVHRSRAVRTRFRRQGHQWVVEELPAYAPELNSVESLWGWCKPPHRGQRLRPDGGAIALAGPARTAAGPAPKSHARGRLLEAG